jgi:superfamily II DNA or RNA helicase
LKNPTIQILKANEPLDFSKEFFIVNAINVSKFGNISEIGCVIVDEVHLIASKVFSRSLQYLTPAYVIGLSATPYRPDGLDILLDLYCGAKRIDKPLFRKHKVFTIRTGFKPKIEYQNNGRVDWNSVLEAQSQDSRRNELIVRIVTKLEEYNYLILCKRVSQIQILEKMLLDQGVSVSALHGTKSVYDTSSKVLIGTIQKLGTGFDAPHLNALLVAADIEEYFIQYLGRVFRKQNVEPVIFDLVDTDFILQKHYKVREKIYEKHGGVIKEMEF